MQLFVFQNLELLIIEFVDFPASRGDLVEHLQLTVEKCTRNLAGHIGTADINPGILVDLSAEKLAAVGSLVA